MAIRNIKKNLAGMEDLLQGNGTEDQIRGDSTVTVTKVDVPIVTAAIATLDVAIWTRARVYSGVSSYRDYIYDANDSSGIVPDFGTGSWIALPNVALVGTVQPATGDWLQGDIMYKSDPAAGGFVGWVCVTSGSPGTWKTFGAISI